MTTAEIAIVISIFSATTAAFSLGWNIYRDVVLKARLEVMFGVRTLLAANVEARPEYVMISATNHGPGYVTISLIQWKDTSFVKWLLRKRQRGFVMHDYTNPVSAQIPTKLDVGERADFLFPYDKECMLKETWSHIGLIDSFGRSHWARRKDIREAQTKWKTDFGQNA